MKQEHIAIARQLYKPTPKVEQLVLEICDLFDKPLPNGVTIDVLRFNGSYLTIGGLSVSFIEREHSHSGILVHWEPKYDISNRKDPYCSAFILRYNSLLKLKRELEKVFNNLLEQNSPT